MSGPDLLRACSLTASAMGNRPRAIGSSMSTGWEVDDRIRGTAISTLEFSGATARLVNQPFTNTFTELAQAIRRKGLQSRRPGFYLMIFAVLVCSLWPAVPPG